VNENFAVRIPRWVPIALIVATDAAAIWFGVHAAVAASFLLVLAGISAALALTVRAETAAIATLALLVPFVFLTVMAGPSATVDCGPRCADLVDAHTATVARTGWTLAIGHALAVLPVLVQRLIKRTTAT
jgi:hypothetical protein